MIDCESFRWITTTNSLPKKNCSVLMAYNNMVMEGEFANGKFYYPSTCAHEPGYCICEPQEGITHWMLLPSPPNRPKMKKFKVYCHRGNFIVTAISKSEDYDYLTFLDADSNIVAQFRDWERWGIMTTNGCFIEEENEIQKIRSS